MRHPIKNPTCGFAAVVVLMFGFSEIASAQSGARAAVAAQQASRTAAVQASSAAAAAAGGAAAGGAAAAAAGAAGAAGAASSINPALLTPAGRAAFYRKQFEEQKQQAEATQMARKKIVKAQYDQMLAFLGSQPNGADNKRQNRLAFDEAKNNYRSLRRLQKQGASQGSAGKGSAGKGSAGKGSGSKGSGTQQRLSGIPSLDLQQPFRLRNTSFNRKKGTVKWPKTLDSDEFKPIMKEVSTVLTKAQRLEAAAASELLGQLQEVNQFLDTSAAEGEIGITDYARSRVFVTGLANEIRAFGVNEPLETAQNDPSKKKS